VRDSIHKKGNYHHDLAELWRWWPWFDYYHRCRLAEDERSRRPFSLIVQKIRKRSICNYHIAGLELSSKFAYKTISINSFVGWCGIAKIWWYPMTPIKLFPSTFVNISVQY
jgi:hypothetical protein